MAAIYEGNEVVRFSSYWMLGAQVGQIDINMSCCTPAFDVAWNSGDFFSELAATNYYTKAKALVPPSVSFIGVKTYCKKPGGLPRIDVDKSGGGIGTSDPGVMPGQVTGLISWRSGVGGPRGRGRCYPPFPTNAHLSAAGTPTADYTDLLVDFANNVLTGFTVTSVGGSASPTTIRPCTIVLQGSGIQYPYPMTAFTAADAYATQRRRGFFGKVNGSPI